MMDNGDHDMKGDICRDYLRKACNRGKHCKFLHPADAEKKLEFCHDYQNSICKRRNCKFIHCMRGDETYYLENGRVPPDAEESSSSSSSRARPSSVGDVGLCRDFMNGKCTRGASCKFRHQSQGDLEYERMQSRSSWGEGLDDYDRPRRPQGTDTYRALARYGRPRPLPPPFEATNYLDFESMRSRSTRDLEDDNARLRQKVEVLRKQVDDLTATNEVLLQQNAQLRTGKSEVAHLHLAMMGQ